ncbi:MAG: SsrA-binding protein SmpB [Acidaminococcaceae bacterium]|jgi:SsrA-binding protein|nr:SsrA-binding protein SmpB [Acidaminococcaceae bacterium]
MAETKMKIIAENRKAHHDYNVLETYETGIELQGTEVKSLRAGKANLKDSYVRVTRAGELVVMGLHISPYEFGNINNHDPLRTRRLLMHRQEIDKIFGKVKTRGYALVPLKLYFKHGLVKMQIALATGKKDYDKRRDLAERDAKREMDRAMKERNH